jgi:hypothetical protein
MSALDTLPPTNELFTRRPLVERHPTLLNDNRVAWALRHRHTNGLNAAGAVFDSPCGELLIHEPAFLRWFLGLAGRTKPRAARRRAAAVAA